MSKCDSSRRKLKHYPHKCLGSSGQCGKCDASMRAKDLIEAGFDYVCEIDKEKLIRK